MNSPSFKETVVSLARASMLGLGLVACNQAETPPEPLEGRQDAPPAASAPQPKRMEPSRLAQAALSEETDDFIETAGSANMLEIKSSELALERTTDPELKAFAERIIKDHKAAGEKLKSLAQAEGMALPQQMLDRHQMMYDKLEGEKNAEAFNERYAELMVSSHREAVALFDEVAKQSKDPQVKALAEALLPTLKEHGGRAQQLDEAAS